MFKQLTIILYLITCLSGLSQPAPIRARDLGIPFKGTPGAFNAITDVKGVQIGYSTIIAGQGKNVRGKGPVRTGVTAILPRGRTNDPVFANWYALNGNGEMTGTTWITESGFLEGPLMITNTNSVGVVRDAVLKWYIKTGWYKEDIWYTYPVVAETYDGILNDIYGFHVKESHAFEALEGAKSGSILEGNVGGGTCMMCLGFKGGTGTASREVDLDDSTYTIGVLVQANFGAKRNLTIAGIPVGMALKDTLNSEFKAPPSYQPGDGSIIVVVATDAPLLPHQLKRIAARVPLGIGMVGGNGENGSGDIFLAFSTANPGAFKRDPSVNLVGLSNDQISPLFEATVQATEEAILNAMVAAETMEGINGNKAYKLPHESVRKLMKKYDTGRADLYKAGNKRVITVPESVLDTFVGVYEGTFGPNPNATLTVTREGNKLFQQRTGGTKFRIFPETENRFFYRTIDVQLEFVRDASGKVVKQLITADGQKAEARKTK